ncbi:MAG: insulinase family protein [Acidobacteria bacterium]|mgnify:CR=1 FL=1|nr:MAG: insulinase family protein [Acidobacteriota bacterium]REK01562.1 MAG: insulinase family protein [Acidobacteriota bacterium]REK14518.1 MAG: insulinase family protein [Acidobacteriota bacterium]REK45233.1 MAG: insulinase family protein [Acidobacteriota bacterium]
MSEEFRKQAPAPLEPVPFNLPPAETFALSNGLKVVTVNDDRQPLVNFRLVIGSGDIHDPDGRTGVSSAVASLLNEGTANFSSKELAEETDRIGATLSASSGSDHTIVKASSLAMYSGEILDLFAELVLRPTFPQNELDLYKQNTIEGLKYQRSQPDFLAEEQVGRIVYGDHPYGINSPTPEQVEALDRESLVEFHRAEYVPNNAVLIAVGDIASEELGDHLERLFGGWQAGKRSEKDFPESPSRTVRTLTIVDRPGSSQSNIVLSNLAIDRRSPDYFPVLVMNQVLGAGASSRLFMNLREEKGYTYGAYSRIYAKRFGGSFEANAEVRTAVTGDSLKEFFYELERIRKEAVPATELEDAQNYLTGVFPIRVETQSGLIAQLVAQQVYGLPDDYLETYSENVRSVTADDVKRVAGSYIHPDKLAIVVVGDAGEVLKQASEYTGDIEVFDTEARPKDIKVYLEMLDAPDAEVSGAWDLAISAQGQELHLKLKLEQSGVKVTGGLDSMLGQGVLKEASVEGGKLSGLIATEMQGQELSLEFSANVIGDLMEGVITIPMMPEPLPFKGERVSEQGREAAADG